MLLTVIITNQIIFSLLLPPVLDMKKREGAAEQLPYSRIWLFCFVLACLLLLVFHTQDKTQMVKSSFRVENKKAIPAGSPKQQALLRSPPQGLLAPLRNPTPRTGNICNS